MQQIVEFFLSLGPWNWLIAALVLFTLETVVPGVLLVWFGLAAAVVGVIVLLVPMPWEWQFVLYALLAVASVFVMRRFFPTDEAPSDQPNLNVRGAQYIGRRVRVAEAIRNGRGRVTIGDTSWLAEGSDADVGVTVEIVDVQGTAVVVKAVE